MVQWSSMLTLLASKKGGHCIRSKARSATYGTSSNSISLCSIYSRKFSKIKKHRNSTKKLLTFIALPSNYLLLIRSSFRKLVIILFHICANLAACFSLSTLGIWNSRCQSFIKTYLIQLRAQAHKSKI